LQVVETQEKQLTERQFGNKKRRSPKNSHVAQGIYRKTEPLPVLKPEKKSNLSKMKKNLHRRAKDLESRSAMAMNRATPIVEESSAETLDYDKNV